MEEHSITCLMHNLSIQHKLKAKMNMWRFTSFSRIMTMFIFLLQLVASSAAINLSPNMQKIALFRFKQSLSRFNPASEYCTPYYEVPSHPKTVNWNMSSDYCTWEGVTCEEKTGNVIGLDLSCSQLEGAILPNSTLFQLSHLQHLNLFGNNFSLSNQFPQEFGFFATGLTHLNLSNTGFSGKVPSGISHLYKLVLLDLSKSFGKLELEYKVFEALLHNLSQLSVLDLEGVNISSALPQNFSTSLRYLNLGNTGLHGVLPQKVFHLPKLEVLDLDNTPYSNLTVLLPKVKWGSSGSLKNLYLGGLNLYEGVPDSLGYLESLTLLYLRNCNLFGPIPRSIWNLTQLTDLFLWDNHLTGQLPNSIPNFTNLRALDLSYNNFIGRFPSWVANLRELNTLYLSNNSLSGPLPSPWLFEHPSLTTLDLGYNRFTGRLYKFDSSKSQLKNLYCSDNLLHGPIPQSFSQLVNLTTLDFFSNNFSGALNIEMFAGLENLESLFLSNNNLSVRSTGTTTRFTPHSKLKRLGLSVCKMKEFPHFLRYSKIIQYLDLSNNQIEGKIPHWIGSMGRDLNLHLSYNNLTGGLEQLPWNHIKYLNLHSNMLSGSLPDLICNSSSLQVLDLSRNNLSGVLPVCPKKLPYSLSVLDLQMNNIHGNLPPTLSNFQHLRTLNLHRNKFKGRIPSSFAEFDYLEVLDLGNNQMNDTFPRCLEALPSLQVLILKSNKFYGLINQSSKIEHPFPSLRIIDLSYNQFSGPLPAIYFKNFRAMMNGDVNNIKPSYMGDEYYTDSTVLVIKGVDMEVVKILTIFTTIDVSRNKFEGKITEYIGNLGGLRLLNLSHNYLTGNIPSLIGKMSVLESLDLSFNQLEGEIPQQLISIYTLARLNLSHNQLSGHIPQGPQFSTFDNDSYIGNTGLCGNPLSKECENGIRTEDEEEDENDDNFFNGFTWEAVVIGYSCSVVPTFITGYLMLSAGKPKWLAQITAREKGPKIRRIEIRRQN